MGVEQYSFVSITAIWIGGGPVKKIVAEVVGSTPTLSTFVNLVEYRIRSRLFLVIVGQIQ
jgi:hypothetical protein